MKIFQVVYLFESANLEDKLGGAKRVNLCSALKARQQCVANSERDFEYWYWQL